MASVNVQQSTSKRPADDDSVPAAASFMSLHEERRADAAERLLKLIPYQTLFAPSASTSSPSSFTNPTSLRTTRSLVTIDVDDSGPPLARPSSSTLDTESVPECRSPVKAGSSESTVRSGDMRTIRDRNTFLKYKDRVWRETEKPLHTFFRRLGGDSFVKKFEDKTQRVRDRRASMTTVQRAKSDQDLESAVKAESRQERDECTVGGSYWVEHLADFSAPLAPPPPSPLTSYPTSPSTLKFHQGTEKYLSKHPQVEDNYLRRVDAYLSVASATRPSWSNIMALLEFTEEAYPEQEQLGGSSCRKLHQGLATALDILQGTQRTRSFVPGVATFGAGKGKKSRLGTGGSSKGRQLVAFIVDHESIILYRLANFTSDENLPAAAALFATLRCASIYDLGFSPLFTYELQPPLASSSASLPKQKKRKTTSTTGVDTQGEDDETTLLAIAPTKFQLPSEYISAPSSALYDLARPVCLNRDITGFVSLPFGRSTIVYDATSSDGKSLVLKAQWAFDERTYRESFVMEVLEQKAFAIAGAGAGSKIRLDPLASVQYTFPTASTSTFSTADPAHHDPFFALDPTTVSPAKTPSFIASYASARMQCQHDAIVPSAGELSQPLRHLEFLLSSNPFPVSPVFGAESTAVSPSDFFRGISSIMKLCRNVYRQHGLLHRDHSLSNFAFSADGRALVFDWENGITPGLAQSLPPSSAWTGTRDVMAVEMLEWMGAMEAEEDQEVPQHHLHHDVESLSNLVWHGVSSKLPHTRFQEKANRWQGLVNKLAFGAASSDVDTEDLANRRAKMWSAPQEHAILKLLKASAPAYYAVLAGFVAIGKECGFGIPKCDELPGKCVDGQVDDGFVKSLCDLLEDAATKLDGLDW